MRPLTARPRR